MGLIPLLKRMVARHGKWNVRDFAFYWNAGLSLFSWCGLVACVPVLISNLVTNGSYFTVCAPPHWYGNNLSGFFVMLLIYSRLQSFLILCCFFLPRNPSLHFSGGTTLRCFCTAGIRMQTVSQLVFGLPR